MSRISCKVRRAASKAGLGCVEVGWSSASAMSVVMIESSVCRMPETQSTISWSHLCHQSKQLFNPQYPCPIYVPNQNSYPVHYILVPSMSPIKTVIQSTISWSHLYPLSKQLSSPLHTGPIYVPYQNNYSVHYILVPSMSPIKTAIQSTISWSHLCPQSKQFSSPLFPGPIYVPNQNNYTVCQLYPGPIYWFNELYSSFSN